MPQEIRQPFDPITRTEMQESRQALDLIGRQNILTDKFLDANKLLEEVRSLASENESLNTVLNYFYGAVVDLFEKIGKTYIDLDDKNEDTEEIRKRKKALRELQRLQIARSEGLGGEHSPDFDLDDEKTVEDQYAEIAQIESEPEIRANFLSTAERRRQANGQKERKGSVAERKKAIKNYRDNKKSERAKAVEYAQHLLNANTLNPLEYDAEKILGCLEALKRSMLVIASANYLRGAHGAQDQMPTALQQINASRFLNEIAKYAKDPNEENYKKMLDADKNLKDSLNIQEKVERVKKIVQEVLTGLLGEMATLKTRVTGINTLATSRAIDAEDTDFGDLKRRFADVSSEVEQEFLSVKSKLEDLLTQMQNGTQEQIEGLALELSEGDIVGIYLSSFNGKIAELKEIMQEMRLLLDPSRRVQHVLAERSVETRQLSAHESDEESGIESNRELTEKLLEFFNDDISSYEASNLGAWASNIKESEDRLQSLSREKRKIIEDEIKNGAIPIFMPGRDTQFSLTVADLTAKLKPVWIKNRERKEVADTYLQWDHFVALIQRKAEKLLKDVPEKPYILLTRPTQKPDERTMNKTVAQQITELKKINDERQQNHQAPAYSMKPHEYASMQKRFTERAVKNGQIDNLDPLDKDTFTRFIDLPLSADGYVPYGYWNPGNRRLGFDGFNAGYVNPVSGFRLSVRVEI